MLIWTAVVAKGKRSHWLFSQQWKKTTRNARVDPKSRIWQIFSIFFLSPLWYFRRVKAPEAKQREAQRSLRSHHVMHTRKQSVHTQRSVYKHSSLVSWFSAGVSGWFPSVQLIVCLAKAAVSDFFCENAPWDRQSLAVCYHVSSPQPPPQSELRLVLC